MIIAIDFDRTMTTNDSPTRLRSETVAIVRAFVAAGHRLILFSCRLTRPVGSEDDQEWADYFDGYREMRRLLEEGGIWRLFEPWERPGKPHADLYLDDRAEKVGVQGLRPFAELYGLHIQIDEYRKEHLGRLAEFEVFLVDGSAIRNRIEIDYVMGGNPFRYHWLPGGEIWIDDSFAGDPLDIASTIVHEVVESLIMSRGVPYEPAHESANVAESEFRTRVTQNGLPIEPFRAARSFLLSEILGKSAT